MLPRKIFILRHAEAALAADDFERPLTTKGVADMKAMARRLEEDGLCPDLVLCSPAKRTRMTLENLLPRVPARFPEKLYNADAGTLYEALKGIEDSIGSVVVIAHNPGIFNLVRFLAAPGSDVPAGYAPGTLTVLECAAGRWTDLMPGENRVLKVLTV